MKSALILSGNLVQDHEFIYPYYRLLEDSFKVDVSLLGGMPVEGILKTKIPPNKDQEVISPADVKIDDYNLLILPGGANAMEYLRQGIGLRSFAQKNPKQEYKREAFEMFSEMQNSVHYTFISLLFRLDFKSININKDFSEKSTLIDNDVKRNLDDKKKLHNTSKNAKKRNRRSKKKRRK